MNFSPLSIAQMARKNLGFFGLILLLALVILPGSSQLPPMDRDEARYMQSSRQMLHSGDIITIRFQEELRAKKPAGIYWMQSASAAFFGDRLWAYRLPSILAGFGVGVMLFAFASQMMTRRQSLLAASIIGTSLIFAVESRLAKTDMMLCFLVLVQQYALWQIFHRARQQHYISGHYSLMMWVAVAFGILVKGPVAPAILAFTAIGVSLWERRFAWILESRPLFGVVVMTMLILPWVLLVSTDTDGAFLISAIRDDFLGKLTGVQEQHFAPFGAHLVALMLVLWPGSLLLARSIQGIWQHRHAPSTRFLLAWIMPFWLVIELAPTKLLHYSLPVLPAIALLIACFASDTTPTKKHWHPAWLIIGFEYLALALGPLLGAAVFIIASLYGGSLWGAACVFLLGCAAGIFGFLWRRDSKPQHLIAMFIAAAIFHASTLGGVLPNIQDFHLAPRIKAELTRQGFNDQPIAVSGYHEPSLVFALGEDVLLFNPEQTALFLLEAADGIALVEAAESIKFLDILSQKGVAVTQIAVIEGYNYAKGAPVRMGIYRRQQ